MQELLESLTQQTVKEFEVIIVEDGSTVRCDRVVDAYRDRLTLQYFFKPNSGPGPSRNFGFGNARGQYMVVFDSDCVIPPGYFEAVDRGLLEHRYDAWGGPDRAHNDFTLLQRAMGYTMSSVLTTGGIRGGKKRIGWFQPRSFNMGISRKVFETTGGFKFDRFAEDIEFSMRMKKEGFKVGLIPEAFVFHKRRLNFKQFYRQVFNFGRGRVLVGRVHAGAVKLTHWFPSVFTLATLALLLLPLIDMVLFKVAASAFFLYLAAIFIHSWLENNSLIIAFLSIPSALLQLWGYGLGFLQERFKTHSQSNAYKA